MARNCVIPLAVPAGLDPASSRRDNYLYEQELIDDGATSIWPLDDLPTQPKALDWVGHSDGLYQGGLLDSARIYYRSSGSYQISQNFHHIIIPYAGFDTSAQTYEIMARPSAAGTILSRKGLFELEVVNSTTFRLTVSGETPIDATVTNAFDGVAWHLVVVLDSVGGGFEFFVEGVSEGTGTFTGAMPTPGNDIYIGRHEDDAASSYRGMLAYASFTPLALIAADVLVHFKAAFDYETALVNDAPYVYIPMQDARPFDDVMDNVETITSAGTANDQVSDGPTFHRTQQVYLDGLGTGSVSATDIVAWLDDSRARSIEFWFRSPDSDNVNPVILCVTDHVDINEFIYFQYITSVGNIPRIRFHYRNNSGTWGPLYNRVDLLLPERALPRGNGGWNHIYLDDGQTNGAGGGTHPRIFVNGVQLLDIYVITGTPTPPQWFSEIVGLSRCYFGRLYYGSGATDNYYDSHYCHIAFHAGRLTDEQILNHYRASQ